MPKYITKDGHEVRSRAEVIVDNLLNDLQIQHQYEPIISLSGVELRPDWFLPSQNLYIEYWGLEEDINYAKNQREKLKLYTEHRLACLSLNDTDLQDCRELEHRILAFINRYSEKGKQAELEPMTINYHELWEGRVCYFCKREKPQDKRKPLCVSCWQKLQKREVCATCGEPIDPVKDEDPYNAYICEACYSESHTQCKICGKIIDYPRQGRSLCYLCYSVVSLASPGLPTPKWVKKKRR
ncbi:MAG: hypothetical protein ACFFDI_22465 [Promethearchaeota archaeon]